MIHLYSDMNLSSLFPITPQDPIQPSQMDHTNIDPDTDGIASFGDNSCAHVFKCQR